MRRGMMGALAILLTLSQAITRSQSGTPPTSAIDITNSDIQAALKNAPLALDQQLRVVDMGKYNLAVGIIHRGPTKDGGPVSGSLHHNITETYVILSGSGTLVTGGTIVDPRERGPNEEAMKLTGPSASGTNKGGYSRVVGAGDVIMIPPDVFHGWTKITDQVTYVSVRPDPDHFLPAGFVNPALKK